MAESAKILVVDDSPTLRAIIRRELEEGGYEVVEATNGLEALTQATLSPIPALITLDIEMPRLNGFETCRKLRDSRYAHFFPDRDGLIPVIFVTSNDTLADRQQGFELGAADFITKPFEKGELLEAVDAVLKPEERLRGMTALVVDDSATARNIVTEILEREGIGIIQAEDGTSAYELMCNRMAEIDIVITDLVMADMGGEELCMRIRRELGRRDIPIIVLTAVPDQSRLLEVFGSGATDYLVKPFAKEELLARLNVHLARMQLNHRLREAVDQLRELNTMKDDLLAICSHDLRSPLNGILGYVDLLSEKDYLEAEDRQGLAQVKQSGEYLMSLINDILDLAKIESGQTAWELEPVSLGAIAQTSVNALGHMAHNKSQELDLARSCPRDVVLGNRNSLIQVVNNLLSNAIKFTPENGRIGLKVEAGADERVFLEVADTGIGISQDRIPHLFERFTRTSQTGTGGELGTGLGLSIVREIVEMHRGEVEVVSEEGKGTCFRLSFPQVTAEEDEPAAGKGETGDELDLPRPAASVEIQGRKILLAEDNPLNAKVARAVLARAGCAVTAVENGLLALQAARRERFDAVLMDMHMPEMDGLEATRQMRSDPQLRDLPILALTASGRDEDVSVCLEAGMDGYLNKPIDRNALFAALREAFQGK